MSLMSQTNVVNRFLKISFGDRVTRSTNFATAVGAIVPVSLASRFGSAECIEIIGDFDVSKRAIAGLSGFSPAFSDSAIQQLVNSRKLVVAIQAATVPGMAMDWRVYVLKIQQ